MDNQPEYRWVRAGSEWFPARKSQIEPDTWVMPGLACSSTVDEVGAEIPYPAPKRCTLHDALITHGKSLLYDRDLPASTKGYIVANRFIQAHPVKLTSTDLDLLLHRGFDPILKDIYGAPMLQGASTTYEHDHVKWEVTFYTPLLGR